MLRRLERSHDNVIGLSLAGDVSADEYQRGASELRDAIARHGTIRVLFRLKDLSMQSFFTALDERFRFMTDHADDIDRVAIVSDDAGTGLLSKLGDPLPQIDVEHFSSDDEDKAWAWLA